LLAFEDAPRRWIALVPRGGRGLADVDAATFVLGAEREGIPDDVLARCDAAATIPLADGAESLNVAAAGAIALYERARRRSTA
jgi:TrmH family RNA methyltransferase